MTRRFALAAALVGTVSAPIAASAVTRDAAPVADENGLAGQGTLFFLAGIAIVALAVVLLPEDQPASP
jgi:hypothetical protein